MNKRRRLRGKEKKMGSAATLNDLVRLLDGTGLELHVAMAPVHSMMKIGKEPPKCEEPTLQAAGDLLAEAVRWRYESESMFGNPKAWTEPSKRLFAAVETFLKTKKIPAPCVDRKKSAKKRVAKVKKKVKKKR